MWAGLQKLVGGILPASALKSSLPLSLQEIIGSERLWAINYTLVSVRINCTFAGASFLYIDLRSLGIEIIKHTFCVPALVYFSCARKRVCSCFFA